MSNEKDRPLGKPDLDLPFLEVPPGQDQPLDEHSHIAGGLVVMAATLPVPGYGVKPCLIYRFANPDGSGFYPAMVLVCDVDQMRKTTVLTSDAVSAAVRAATKGGA